MRIAEWGRRHHEGGTAIDAGCRCRGRDGRVECGTVTDALRTELDVDDLAVGRAVRHKSITTTERYAHLSWEISRVLCGRLRGFVIKSVVTWKAGHVSAISPQLDEAGQAHAMLRDSTALLSDAGVVKLADARDSKSRGVYAP